MKNYQFPMSPFLLILFFNLLKINELQAQEGYEITVKLTGYNYDTLWFGRSFGKRAVAEFPAKKQSDGSFLLKNDSLKADGFYAIVYKRGAKAKYQFFPVILSPGSRKFSLETSIDKPYANAQVPDSEENALLYTYLREEDKLSSRRDSLAFSWRDDQSSATFHAWLESEEALRKYQDKIIRENPGTWTASLAKTSFVPKPEVSGSWEEQSRQRWVWFQNHFFENVDPTKPEFFRSPLNIEFMDYFMFKLPIPEPDSIKKALDQVYKRLEPNPDHLKYYFNYIVNSFGSISKWRGDEIFVYAVRNYIEKGKAPWTKPDEMSKMLDDANRYERVFVGKPAPSVTLYKQDKTPVEINSIKSPFTLMIFWNPDCGHCQKELPILKRVLEPFTQKGLQVVAVCGKTRDDHPQCWEYVGKNPFPENWILVGDPDGKSRMGFLYNLRTFPRMYLLDANKKIVWKRVGEVPEREIERTFSDFIELGN